MRELPLVLCLLPHIQQGPQQQRLKSHMTTTTRHARQYKSVQDNTRQYKTIQDNTRQIKSIKIQFSSVQDGVDLYPQNSPYMHSIQSLRSSPNAAFETLVFRLLPLNKNVLMLSLASTHSLKQCSPECFCLIVRNWIFNGPLNYTGSPVNYEGFCTADSTNNEKTTSKSDALAVEVSCLGWLVAWQTGF